MFLYPIIILFAALFAGGCDFISKLADGVSGETPSGDSSPVRPAAVETLIATSDGWRQDPTMMETAGYRGSTYAATGNDLMILMGSRALIAREKDAYRVFPLILPKMASVSSIVTGDDKIIYIAGDGVYSLKKGGGWSAEEPQGVFNAIGHAGKELIVAGAGGLIYAKSREGWRRITGGEDIEWLRLSTAGETTILGGEMGRVGIYRGGKWSFENTSGVQSKDISLYGSKRLFQILDSLNAERGAGELIDLDVITRLNLLGEPHNIAAVWVNESEAPCFITEWGLEYCKPDAEWTLINRRRISECGLTVNGFIERDTRFGCPTGRVVAAGYIGEDKKLITINTHAHHFEAHECDRNKCRRIELPSYNITRYKHEINKPLFVFNGNRIAMYLPERKPPLVWLENMSISPDPKNFLGVRMYDGKPVAVASDGSVFELEAGRWRQLIKPIKDLHTSLQASVQTAGGDLLAVGEKIYLLEAEGWREIPIPGARFDAPNPFIYPFQGSRAKDFVALLGKNEGLFWNKESKALDKKELFNLEDPALKAITPEGVANYRILKVTQTIDDKIYILFDTWRGYYRENNRGVLEIYNGRVQIRPWALRNIFVADDGRLVRMTASSLIFETGRPVPKEGGAQDIVRAPGFLYSCFAFTAREVYCLSDNSKILKYKDGFWAEEDAGVGYDGIDPRISDIWGDSKGNMYIAAINGVLRYKIKEGK